MFFMIQEGFQILILNHVMYYLINQVVLVNVCAIIIFIIKFIAIVMSIIAFVILSTEP